ncbi:uncharacterized protein B0I36DRAFT_348900 [Microdochium trichocladiopsis]|uniref:Uncharacterized protein n=1 Tax=Microdochium trichocladiopsis TaxID=1682393 RepID=A0A9P8Y8M1_9PEZI|nr:uncharacterized protein B0I36DRAFT_348900 [Microdochium trichocladiopsis]KAH7030705.1 hypothetical protein B0I36DRAFT_348900 [Microdochium trichocladiopsis]
MASPLDLSESSFGSDNARRPLPSSLRPAPLTIPPRNPARATASPPGPEHAEAATAKGGVTAPSAGLAPKRRSVASRLGSIISKFEMLDAVSTADAASAQSSFLPGTAYPRENRHVPPAAGRMAGASRHSIELSPYRVNRPSQRLRSSAGQSSAMLISPGS